MKDKSTMLEYWAVLEYEIYGSCWAKWIGPAWAQDLVIKWFTWRVRVKMRRYEHWKRWMALRKAGLMEDPK